MSGGLAKACVTSKNWFCWREIELSNEYQPGWEVYIPLKPLMVLEAIEIGIEITRIIAFHRSLKEAFDKHIPAHTKSVSLRRKVPWFTDDVRDAKRQMRRWKRLWCKYKSDELWTAFHVAWLHYKEVLYSTKRDVISSKFMDCGKDTQKLYALVNNLLGTRKENSLPCTDSPEELAENFSNFFFEKVEKIWQELNSYSKYVPPVRKTHEFNFVPLTEKEVLSIIMGMPAKYCDLDPIPSQVLKDLALYLAKELTKLVNVSLMHRVCKGVEVRYVKPLLKKIGMDIYDSKSFRPVSNLIFLAKSLRSVCYHSSHHIAHCLDYCLHISQHTTNITVVKPPC